MFIRQTSLTIACLCVAGAALAQQAPQTAAADAPVLLAAASIVPIAQAQAAAPRQVHGTLRGVLAAADQGPEALRRYLWRTRMIYDYQFEDFVH